MAGSVPRIVMKFGGTSVGDLNRIKNVAQRVKKQKEAGCAVLVVVSAMAGETDRLVSYCQEISPLYDPAEYDSIVATGEQVTSGLVALALQTMGVPSRSFAGWQVPIQTDLLHSKANLDTIDGARLLASMEKGIVPVVAGFQGVTSDKRVSTLGRGGSDTSAVALAAAIQADRCDIYTDVDGIYTTDPRI
ncbi:MAG: aspartate kinase, partial [Acetobacter sp.]|nr:aspartate kinase [Acetobacter sp.]